MRQALNKLNIDVRKTKNIEQCVMRIEKKLNIGKSSQNVSVDSADEQEVESVGDDENNPFGLANIKDDISYALLSCFSIFFIYKLYNMDID